MITRMVDSADFMLSEPDDQVSTVDDQVSTVDDQVSTLDDQVSRLDSAPSEGLFAKSLASIPPGEVSGTANAMVTSAAAIERGPEMSSPTAPAGVPVAVRNGTSVPEKPRRVGRRRRRQPDVVVRKPEEWVLDPGDFTQLPERAYQELWFELRTWTWKSLAVVPTVSGCSELDVAEKLVVVGVSNTNRRMSLISAEGASVADTDRVIAMIRAAEARGDRVIVCTDSIHDNPAAAPIIRAVNGAVLSVRLGRSEKVAVERTIATIHRNRIIGVITRRAR